MAVWSYRVCDRDGTNLREVALATDRVLALPLNAIPSASFAIRTDDVNEAVVLGLTGQLLKVYRNDVLMFCGPILTAEETSGGEGRGKISVNAAGVFWRLGKRLLGKSWDGQYRGVGWSYGTPLAMQDRVQILKAIIDTVNGEADSGIRIGSITNSGINAYAGPHHFKPASEAFMEIASTFDGPDWRVNPTEPTIDAAGVKLATIDIAPALLTDRSQGQAGAVIFEYNTGLHNVKSYVRARSLDGLANRAWANPTGYPDSHPTGQAPHPDGPDATSQAQHGLADALVSDDLVTDSFRVSIAAEHKRVRKQARETIAFQLVRNPQPDYGDFVVGDLVTARAVEAGTTRFDATFRVYGVGFTIDEEGNEDMAVTLQLP